MKSWLGLEGRFAAVTGAAAGIGRAAALAMACEGVEVLALDLDGDGADRVAAEIREAGGKAGAARLDVTSADEWDAIERRIREKHGRLDILVNSAGVSLADSVGDASLGVYQRTFAINVEGSLLGMQVALGFMRAQGKGAIINLSSQASLRGNTLMASYGASKAAIAHFTRSAAVETIRAGHDIRINAILPGLIETSMADDLCRIYEKIGPPGAVRAAVTTGRSGRPEEVADLIAFLASDRASYIAGASIVIDRAASA